MRLTSSSKPSICDNGPNSGALSPRMTMPCASRRCSPGMVAAMAVTIMVKIARVISVGWASSKFAIRNLPDPTGGCDSPGRRFAADALGARSYTGQRIVSADIIPFAEAAERARARARRVEPALGPVNWLWLISVLALPLWVPVLVGFTVVEIVGGQRR